MNQSDFIEKLCKVRDKCSESSANTHFLQLKRIWRIANNKEKRFVVKKIPKTSSWITPNLLDKIKKLELIPQRNLIVSCVVYLQFTKANKKKLNLFSDRMYEIVKEIKQNHKPYERNEKQKKNWITENEVNQFWEERLTIANRLLRKRFLTKREKGEIQKSIIVAIHFGKGLPPSRLDFSTATWSKSDSAENNNTMVFRKAGRWYVSIFGKTRRIYGKSILPIHKPLSKLIHKWFNKTGVIGKRVFLNSKQQPFNHSTYGNYIKRIFHRKFHKNIGASLLRSIFISHKYKNLPKILREYEVDARKMLHSRAESQKTYLKSQ